MSIKEKYEDIIISRKKIINELDALMENEYVKKYLELCDKNNMLINQEEVLYTNLKNEEFDLCNHIWIISRAKVDGFNRITERFHGCIKCGLNSEIHSIEYRHDIDSMSIDEKIMYNYMENHNYRQGIYLDEFCDLDLAKALYSKVRGKHPNIDDMTVCKYFEIALNDIRNIKVNKDRKINRAKRLCLNKNFSRWDRSDIRY